MNTALNYVVNEFNKAQTYVVQQLLRRGIPIPKSDINWVEIRVDIINGKYPDAKMDGIKSHGYGLSFKDDKITIDFDFGPNGEINGFAAGKLWYFIKSNKININYEGEKEIQKDINSAVADGEYTFGGYINYYPKTV